jgi:hypothetical protein
MLRGDHYGARGWRLAATLDRLDPETHRRIKGLRLVTAFGLAAMLATVAGIAHGRGMLLGTIASGFALWASVSEARSTRYESARDLTLLCVAAGAASFAIVAKGLGTAWAELTLVTGSFCVGYLKRFGMLGGSVGSQLFIGQLLAYGATIVNADLGTVALVVYAMALPERYDITCSAYAFALVVTWRQLESTRSRRLLLVPGRRWSVVRSEWPLYCCSSRYLVCFRSRYDLEQRR